jgi:hypothetical protein
MDIKYKAEGNATTTQLVADKKTGHHTMTG